MSKRKLEPGDVYCDRTGSTYLIILVRVYEDGRMVDRYTWKFLAWGECCRFDLGLKEDIEDIKLNEDDIFLFNLRDAMKGVEPSIRKMIARGDFDDT